ncbi:MAG: macro domain-containing protein [Candidatus Nealsonbacteria bacterium]|nr:macro domain-containing protein [Candidatus Nealsonbacteria bacterium]
MINFLKGNMFEADVEALVNTVNTVGVMGKGIALQFSRAFPEIMKPYKDACESGQLEIGSVFTVKLSMLEGPKYVINLPTKKHWKGKSKIEFIQSGLQALVDEIQRLGIRSVAVPPLGCGLGGLRWDDVKREIESALGELSDVDVLVFEPAGKPPASRMKTATKRPKMSPGRAALLGLMRRYVAALMDDEVTLLELHKLMYFLKEAGEVPKLHFVKGRYGPYSTNLRHVLTDIEGHYITGFGDASEEPGKVLEPMPGAVKKAEKFLKTQPKTLECFHRVEDLIDGFETAYGMELLASVHWVAKHEQSPAKTCDDGIRMVHDWNPRKRDTFAPEHIRVAWERLSLMAWL